MKQYTQKQLKEVEHIKRIINKTRYRVTNNIHCTVFVNEEDNIQSDNRARKEVETGIFLVYDVDTRTLNKMVENGEIEIISTNGWVDEIRPLTF